METIPSLTIHRLNGEDRHVEVEASMTFEELRLKLSDASGVFQDTCLVHGTEVLHNGTVAQLGECPQLHVVTAVAMNKVWDVVKRGWFSSRSPKYVFHEHLQLLLEMEDGWKHPGPNNAPSNNEFASAIEILGANKLDACDCQRLWNLFGIPSSGDLDLEKEHFSTRLADPPSHWSLRKYFDWEYSYPASNGKILMVLETIAVSCEPHEQLPFLRALLKYDPVQASYALVVLEELYSRGDVQPKGLGSKSIEAIATNLGLIVERLPLKWLVFSRAVRAACRLQGRFGGPTAIASLEQAKQHFAAIGLSDLKLESDAAVSQISTRYDQIQDTIARRQMEHQTNVGASLAWAITPATRTGNEPPKKQSQLVDHVRQQSPEFAGSSGSGQGETSPEEALLLEQQDLMKACLNSKADIRNADRVRIMRLTWHKPDTMQQLASSRHLDSVITRVKVAGCSVLPEWSNGALLLIPLTCEQAAEADDWHPMPHHIMLLDKDLPQVCKALEDLPRTRKASRPKLRPEQKPDAGSHLAPDASGSSVGDISQDRDLHSDARPLSTSSSSLRGSEHIARSESASALKTLDVDFDPELQSRLRALGLKVERTFLTPISSQGSTKSLAGAKSSPPGF